MNNDLSDTQQSFRVHFIRVNGPESDPKVRVLLVESTSAQSIYERFGTWSQCRRTIVQISECAIFGDQFADIERRLEMNRMGSIKDIHVSVCDLESAGFRRADS